MKKAELICTSNNFSEHSLLLDIFFVEVKEEETQFE